MNMNDAPPPTTSASRPGGTKPPRFSDVLLAPSATSGFPLSSRTDFESTPIPPLQLTRLRELSLGDQDFERDILECLLSDVASGINRLVGAFDPLDPPQVANILHGIVGACRTVGAESLGQLCRAYEQAARQPHFQPDPAWLAAIERERIVLIAAVNAHLGL